MTTRLTTAGVALVGAAMWRATAEEYAQALDVPLTAIHAWLAPYAESSSLEYHVEWTRAAAGWP